jgi:hypothetical protein
VISAPPTATTPAPLSAEFIDEGPYPDDLFYWSPPRHGDWDFQSETEIPLKVKSFKGGKETSPIIISPASSPARKSLEGKHYFK